MKTNNGVQLVVLLAGEGKRFRERYACLKPLIRIRGETMIAIAFRTLSIPYEKVIFVTRKDHDIDGILTNTIKSIVPDSTIVGIDSLTEGPCCSALLAKPFLDPSLPLVVANCDQVMRWNGKRFVDYCMREDYDGVVVTYHENTPKNSYVKLNDVGDVIQVKEKEQISCVSLNGIHFWKKAQYFFDSSSEMILKDERTNGEFYIAPSYNFMVSAGKRVGIYHIPNEQHWGIGVPEDLDRYIQFRSKDDNQKNI